MNRRERDERIRDLYVNEGQTMAAVGRLMGVSMTTVHRVLTGFQVPRRGHQNVMSGTASAHWKPTGASYGALHERVNTARGKPTVCERCGLCDPEARFEWANLTGSYEDISDYERMCVPCHRKFDQAKRNPNPKRPGRPRANVICWDCGNTRPHTGRGLCGTCYARRRRAGWPTAQVAA